MSASSPMPAPHACHRTGATASTCPCFAAVDAWIFDLDNTLYPGGSNLFEQVAEKMNLFLIEHLGLDREGAKKMRRDYYLEYGTTLAGLMARHDLDPDPFLDFVHDIDHSVLDPHPRLADAIRLLPGRKFVFTNGSVNHAAGVLRRLEIPLELFDGVHDIKACNYVPKPETAAFASFIDRFGIQPERTAMFEDLPHNLVTAHDLGMATVLVSSNYDDHPSQAQVKVHDTAPEHIQHATDDIEGFVRTLL